MYLFKPIEYSKPRVSPNINYHLGVIMMCQSADVSISCNTFVTLVRDDERRGGYACVGPGGYGKSLYFLLNCAVKLRLIKKEKKNEVLKIMRALESLKFD